MGEPARELQTLDGVVGEIVRKVTTEGVTVHQAIDDMWPIHLRPNDQAQAVREGLRSLANGRAGMRSVRSGKRQSSRGRVRPVLEASAGLEEFADRVLARLIFETADERMASVLEFTHEDAEAAYHRRVRAPREQAEREEPFWLALLEVTGSGWTLQRRSLEHRSRLARLAVQAELTRGGDE